MPGVTKILKNMRKSQSAKLQKHRIHLSGRKAATFLLLNNPHDGVAKFVNNKLHRGKSNITLLLKTIFIHLQVPPTTLCKNRSLSPPVSSYTCTCSPSRYLLTVHVAKNYAQRIHAAQTAILSILTLVSCHFRPRSTITILNSRDPNLQRDA